VRGISTRPLQFHEGFDVGHVRVIERWRVAVRIGLECRAVYYSFVKDEPILFHDLTDVNVFGVWVAFEDLTRNRDVASLVLRVLVSSMRLSRMTS